MKNLSFLLFLFFSNCLFAQNVGIGTSNPAFPLDVDGRIRVRYKPASGSAGIWFNKSDNSEGAFTGMITDSTYGFYGENYWRMGFNIKTAQLGIGTLDPTAPLSFPNSIGNKIALWGDARGGHYGLGIQGSLMQLYVGEPTADIAFGYGSSAAFTESMRIKGNGNVGIGIANPTSKLVVVGNNNSQTGYFEQTGTGAALNANTINGTGLTATTLSATLPAISATSFGGSPAIIAGGKIKIIDGTQAAGKVLTSDASGTGSWKNTAFGNTERFQFQLAKNGAAGVFNTLYNFGTATAASLSNTAYNKIDININKAGLYHFDVNVFDRVPGNFSQNAAVPSVVDLYVENISEGKLFSLQTGAFVYDENIVQSKASINTSFDLYIPSGKTINFTARDGTASTYRYLTITGHLISE